MGGSAGMTGGEAKSWNNLRILFPQPLKHQQPKVQGNSKSQVLNITRLRIGSCFRLRLEPSLKLELLALEQFAQRFPLVTPAVP
jgi:hypothetical protein